MDSPVAVDSVLVIVAGKNLFGAEPSGYCISQLSVKRKKLL